MPSDENSREDLQDIRKIVKDATERLRALERRVDAATDRIIYVGACEQKLRDIRGDLDAVRAKLQNVNSDARCALLRLLQAELDGPRLPEIEARYLGRYLECLRGIGASIREDMLNAPDVSELAIRNALRQFDDMWRRAEEEEKRRIESDQSESAG